MPKPDPYTDTWIQFLDRLQPALSASSIAMVYLVLPGTWYRLQAVRYI